MNTSAQFRPMRRHGVKLILAMAMLAGMTTGCDGILGSDRALFARNARVIVSNDNSLPLLLVTSTRFLTAIDPLTGQETVILNTADTVRINGATFDQTFDIYGKDRFYTQLINPDVSRTATVQLRVQLDERDVYNQRATLRDASLQYYNYYRP